MGEITSKWDTAALYYRQPAYRQNHSQNELFCLKLKQNETTFEVIVDADVTAQQTHKKTLVLDQIQNRLNETLQTSTSFKSKNQLQSTYAHRKYGGAMKNFFHNIHSAKLRVIVSKTSTTVLFICYYYYFETFSGSQTRPIP